MDSIATTRLSTKGQVVIPEEIREQLGLEPGTQFVVVGAGDSVILKVLSPPSVEEFKNLLKDARKAARRAGLGKADVAAAIQQVREKKGRSKS